MPKLSGLFDSFDNLDQISPEAIAAWIKPTPNLIQLENYLANKILYPAALPVTESDMKIDLGILREALKINRSLSVGDNPFLNITLRKVLIPVRFVNFVPNLSSLVWAFIDAFLQDRKKADFFEDLWTIVLTDDTDEIIGSILLPQFEGSGGVGEVNLLGKKYHIQPGSLMVIPCPKDRCEIAYKFRKGKILGRQESAVEVYGGKLGLVIDGRSI